MLKAAGCQIDTKLDMAGGVGFVEWARDQWPAPPMDGRGRFVAAEFPGVNLGNRLNVDLSSRLWPTRTS